MKKNVIRFIHIKKNGGTSVYKFLRKNKIEVLLGHQTNFDKVYNQHIYASNYVNEDSYKFCVCRNPYTRIVSFYNWTTKMPQYKNITFDEFVLNQINTGRFLGAWNLQSDYILDKQDNCLVDKIFRFENLETEIKEHFKIDAPFPHLTRSTFDNYKNYYRTKNLQKIVYQKLEKDFQYFNYNEEF